MEIKIEKPKVKLVIGDTKHLLCDDDLRKIYSLIKEHLNIRDQFVYPFTYPFTCTNNTPVLTVDCATASSYTNITLEK